MGFIFVSSPLFYALQLHKSAGEEFIQLFDLSVVPKNHSADDSHNDSDSLSSLIYRGRSDYALSLGTLLYRIAHRLSLSMVFCPCLIVIFSYLFCHQPSLIILCLQSSNNRARCASFFQKCLSFLDDPDHLVGFEFN